MGLSTEEQETIIRYGRNEAEAIINTTDSTTITKLDKLADDPGSDWERTEVIELQGETVGKTYKAPKQLISFRSKVKHVELTEEQKRELAERMKRNLHGIGKEAHGNTEALSN